MSIRASHVLILVIVLIVYGSLYPWDFIFEKLPANPVWILITSWHGDRRGDFPTRDFIANIALYVPLGMCGFLAFRNRGLSRAVVLGAPVALGLGLSICIELLQIYDPLRYCSALDVVANGMGSLAGVLAGRTFASTVDNLRSRHSLRSAPEPVAIGLLFCWSAHLLFPFFPVLSRTVLREKFTVFASAPFPIEAFVYAAITWFVVGRLLGAAGVPAPTLWLWVATLIIPARLFIVTRQPTAVEWAGALVGCLAFTILRTHRRAPIAAAAAFLLVVFLRGATPLDGGLHEFGWIPFAALLDTEDQQRGFGIIVEKAFYYGAAIWAVRSAGARLRTATVLVAATLGCVEVLQIWLPGRTPEITDPVLAVILGCVFRWLERETAATVK